MPQTRGLSTLLNIFVRNARCFDVAQSAVIGTCLANQRRVLGAVGVADFGRATHVIHATSVAILAARAHEATTTAPSARL